MDQSPFIIKSIASILDEGDGSLPISLPTCTTNGAGKDEAGTAFKSLSKILCC